MKKVVDIWKKSATFSSEALKPCYARLSGELPEADAKSKKNHAKRQCPLSSIPWNELGEGRMLCWSATRIGYRCGDPYIAAMGSTRPSLAAHVNERSPLLRPLKVVDGEGHCSWSSCSIVQRWLSYRPERLVIRILTASIRMVKADQTASRKQFLVVSQYHAPTSVCATETLNVKLRRYSPLFSYPTWCRCNLCRRNFLLRRCLHNAGPAYYTRVACPSIDLHYTGCMARNACLMYACMRRCTAVDSPGLLSTVVNPTPPNIPVKNLQIQLLRHNEVPLLHMRLQTFPSCSHSFHLF